MRTKLIDDASQWPNITFLIILLIINLLRTHIIWCTNMGKSKLGFVVHYSSQAEISKLDITVSIQEDVSRLQVSMEDFLRPIRIALINTLIVTRCWILFLIHSIVNLGGLSPPMAVVKGAHRLSEHLPNEIFSNVILWFSTPTNQLLKVSTIAMLHNNEDFGLLLIYDSIMVFDNVRVI